MDKLPKDVRGHVERMLGGSQLDKWLKGRNVHQFKLPEGIKVPTAPRKAVRVQPRVQRGQPVEKQLEKMRGELREIRKALDELLKSRRKPRGKKAKSE